MFLKSDKFSTKLDFSGLVPRRVMQLKHSRTTNGTLRLYIVFNILFKFMISTVDHFSCQLKQPNQTLWKTFYMKLNGVLFVLGWFITVIYNAEVLERSFQ